jgi:heme/copper-type cytochrome/quinol oxidase subunit 2
MDNNQNQPQRGQKVNPQQLNQAYSSNLQNSAETSNNNQQPQYQVNPPAKGAKSNILRGILWILSPIILLVVIVIIQIIVHFILSSQAESSSTGMIANSPVETVLNIASILGGMAALVLIPVGLIVGLKILSKK